MSPKFFSVPLPQWHLCPGDGGGRYTATPFRAEHSTVSHTMHTEYCKLLYESPSSAKRSFSDEDWIIHSSMDIKIRTLKAV